MVRRTEFVQKLDTRAARRAVTVVVACVAIATAVVGVAGAQSDRPVDHTDWAATKALVGPTLARLPHDRSYLLRGSGPLGYGVQYGIIRALLDHGYHAFVAPTDVQLSRDYASTNPRDYVLSVTDQSGSLSGDEQLIAMYEQSSAAQRTALSQARATAVAALRAEPLLLTSYGEQQRRHASGLTLIVLDAARARTVTPDEVLDSALDRWVTDSRLHPNQPHAVFVVGPRVLPALAAYDRLRRTVSGVVVRVILIPPG